jgi:hypothetical protein
MFHIKVVDFNEICILYNVPMFLYEELFSEKNDKVQFEHYY